MLIQPNEPIWVYRTASSSPIINISPVSKRGKELDTGQFCCCGGSIQSFVQIKHTHAECSKQIELSGHFFNLMALQIRNRDTIMATEQCRGNRGNVASSKSGYFIQWLNETIQSTLQWPWSDLCPCALKHSDTWSSMPQMCCWMRWICIHY